MCSLCYHPHDRHYVDFDSDNDFGCYDCQYFGGECSMFRKKEMQVETDG